MYIDTPNGLCRNYYARATITARLLGAIQSHMRCGGTESNRLYPVRQDKVKQNILTTRYKRGRQSGYRLQYAWPSGRLLAHLVRSPSRTCDMRLLLP